MASKKIESLSFAEIRNLAKKKGRELTSGDGWQTEDFEPLGVGLQALADSLHAWLAPNQNWSLTDVNLMFLNSGDPEGTSPKKKQIGEITQIEPDKLTIYLQFLSEKPPRQLFSSKLFITGAFDYSNYRGMIRPDLYDNVPKGGVMLRAEQFGPLRTEDSALSNPDCPYYLLGKGVVIRPSNDLENEIVLSKRNPDASITAIVEAADLLDFARMKANETRRFRDQLTRNFPQA